MAKTYPLEIENVGDDEYIVMSRGHHDFHEFMRKVRDEGFDWPLTMPQHKWVRRVPTRKRWMNCIYVFANEGERGAFPATYAWEAHADETYEAVCAANQAKGDA
ncbi:hypothetical protein PIN31115_02049 [Pandoraea iniqua]|uniref:Uncharacterized protein n=1 Tax=Pandoraea iniqua TaxID=2508288 RepID=A0A5E4UIN3_9BURK|nr:hypothetical protein [Pandoraea iniqua]VVD99906.1 hypothetical protein PIN31115_02049 [Pandoraea iniqua]